MIEDAAHPLLVAGEEALRVSASAFEDFVKCPLLAFFKRSLRLRPPLDPSREMSALARGSAVHAILWRFEEIAAAEGTPAAERPRLLDRVAREELARLPLEGLYAEVFADELLRGLVPDGVPARPGLLRGYLESERARKDGFRPGFFEARFGRRSSEDDSASVASPDPVPIGVVEAAGRRLPLLLHGSIDRVDLLDEGGEVLAFVLDYKTGKVAQKRRETKNGRLFQLPLYAHVLPAVLGPRLGGKRVRAVAAAYYRIDEPGDVGLAEPLADERWRGRVGSAKIEYLEEGGFERLVAAVVARAQAVASAQVRGRFHPTAVRDSCSTCDFAECCRGRGEAERIAAMAEPERFPQSVELVPGEKKRRGPS